MGNMIWAGEQHHQHAVEHHVDQITGEKIYRSLGAPEDLNQTMNYEINSIYSMFMKTRNRIGDSRCLGTKVVSGETPPHYEWSSFNQIYETTQLIASSMLKHKLFSKIDDLQVLGITSVNCEQWVVTDLASNLIGVTSVPLYETLGEQMMALILEQTKMSTIFGSEKCLMNILGTIKHEERPH